MTAAANATSPLSAAADAARLLDDPLEQGRFTRWVAGPQGQRWAESALQLAGLRCAACSGIIERALVGVDGVVTAQVSAAAERATVCWDPERTRPSALIAAVRAAGYDAVPDASAPARELRRQVQRQALWRLFVAAFCAMQVMMFATPSYVAKPGDLTDEMRQLLNWGSWILTLPVMAFSAWPYLRGAWVALRARSIAMDVPVALGIVITFVASSGATFQPGGLFGHEVYFDSLTMFVSFLLGARWLELQSRHRAADALERVLARLPETAWRIGADGQATPVSVLRLHVGDRVRVPLGQAFPADGVLETGSTQADEALLSGESSPVDKHPGDAVVAGSTNVGSPVVMSVQRVGGDTRLETIVSMMRSAMGQRPAAARLADRWAAPFLWVVLLLAAGAAAAWSVIEPARAVWVAVSVLIVTCPCALSLAAPATLVATARGLARRGVLLQRLDALEVLARARHVVFDKTGTLTEDRLQWRSTHLAPGAAPLGIDQVQALALAGSLADWSAHPASRALVAASTAPDPAPCWHSVHEQAGRGLSARDGRGRLWQLGRADPSAAAVDPSAVTLTCEGVAVAHFELEEVLRPGTAEALHRLVESGAQLHLLSGDSQPRALALAARVGIPHVVAGASPEAKLAAVAALQAQGDRVVMVGDGVNDAPVLARADASLAMGQGALVSRSNADAVITSNDLRDLAGARASAQRTLAIVHQNFIWAASYNALCIPMALVGWLPPWAAGLGMALSSLLVVGNALRAARPAA